MTAIINSAQSGSLEVVAIGLKLVGESARLLLWPEAHKYN